MSASQSFSDTKTTSASNQSSTQGASGNQSPTLTSTTGNVEYNDQSGVVAQQAFPAIVAVVQQALTNAASVNSGALSTLGDLNAQSQRNNAAQSVADNQTLAAALAASQTLASTQGTGGLNLTSKSYNYMIWGALALAAFYIFSMFNRSK